MDRSPAAPAPSPQRPEQETYIVYEPTPWTSTRSLKQLSWFCLGATCFLASTAFTRRAVYNRNIRLKPKYFSPNTNPHEFFSPFNDALQALNLATINCLSVGLLLGSGALWSVDISGLEEMRANLRGRLNYDAIYQMEADPEDEPEESLEASITRKREEEATAKGPKTTR